MSPMVVVGTGLIGASIGCAMTRAGAQVHLRDKVRSHAMVAAARGAGVVAAPKAEEVRLVVVAVPPDAIADVVAQALKRYPNAIVTDVGSVKGTIADQVQGLVADATRYVGSHPMAGSAYAGPLTAVPELFVDRTWVITPRADNPEWVIDGVRELARRCRARIIEWSVDDHDRAVAEVSHLPQLMASLTAARLSEVPRGDLALAGPGVRDVTRIAASNPILWRQIIASNRDQVLAQLTRVRHDLDALIDGLDEPDTVESLIERGRLGVRALPFKHGRSAEELASVIVQIPDAPGSLASLFADIQGLGVNIEDLSIEHDPEREVGFLSIQVDPGKADELRAAMADRGWGLRA